MISLFEHMMKKGLISSLITLTLVLTGCSGFGKKDGPQYKGHYLVELYEPEKVSEYGCSEIKCDDKPAIMNDEKHYNGWFFTTNERGATLMRNANECDLVYKIDGNKYKSLCFYAGTIESIGERKYVTNYTINDSCALTIFADGERIFDEYFPAEMAPKYYSLDINGATELEFFIDQHFYHRCFGVLELTLWKEANKSIEKNVEPATEAEDLLDNSYYLYGEQKDGDFTGGYVILDKAEKTMTINGKTYDKGIALNPRYSEERRVVSINTRGRYEYMHFNLGHIDAASKDGAIYVNIYVDLKGVLSQRIDDGDLPLDITIPLNRGSIISITFFGDPQDDTRTDMYSYGYFGIYNMIGAPR